MIPMGRTGTGGSTRTSRAGACLPGRSWSGRSCASCAVLQPQVDRLTCANTSTHRRSQAPDEPTRAPFATQSATHFDLADEPSYEVVDIQFDDRAVRVPGLSPRSTSANRLRSARRAVQGWANNATQRVMAGVYADRTAALALEIDDPGAGCWEAPRRDLVDSATDFAWLVTQQRYPGAPRRTPHSLLNEYQRAA
jgi:hypothetical protein